mmetsp:Transcript_119069/g.348654  ORF Transcript_119069/g.348654 Transcript_119069/m.348654 type:complete len:329 (-) Transcript_119069:1803-2789(-)
MDALQVLWHAYDTVPNNLLHQSRLACAILANDTIAVIFLHLKVRVLEEEHPTAVHEKQVLNIQERLGVVRASATTCIESGSERGTGDFLCDHRKLLLECFVRVPLQLNGDLEVVSDLRHDLAAAELLLPPLQDDRRNDGVAVRADLCRLRRERCVRLQDLLRRVACATQLPLEGRIGIQVVLGSLPGSDALGSAACRPVRCEGELEAGCLCRLVSSLRLHLPSLDQLVNDLHGMLLRAETKLASSHAAQHLLYGGHHGLLNLWSPACSLPCAVRITLDGRIRVKPHHEDECQNRLARLLGGAVLSCDKILAKPLMLKDLVNKLAQEHS